MQNSTIIRLFLILLLTSSAGAAVAQTLNSTYFLDHDNTHFRINPALMPDESVNVLAGVAIGGISLTPQTNIRPSALYFPVDGEIVSGLDSRVSSEQFLGGLNDNNSINVGANIGLLTVGFRPEEKGFATIEFNVRSNTYSDVPKSVFTFLKDGPSENRFNIRNFDITSSNFVELALGYSRKIGKIFQVGGRIKVLGGLGRTDMIVDLISVDYDSFTELMELSSAGSLSVYCPGLHIGTKTNPDGTVVYDLSNTSVKFNSLAGFGLAFDLGVSCTPLEGLELQAAIQDLGFIDWKKTVDASMSASTVVLFQDDDPKEAMNSILNFEASAVSGSTGMSLPMTLRFGARYAMPFYDRLSFGILETLETGGSYYTYNDLRIGATITPIDQISVAVNYGLTSLGSTMGLAVNFNLWPVQFYVGADSVLMKYTAEGVADSPLNSTLSAGLLLQFKRRR